MDTCDNPLCEHEAAHTACVSVCWAGDEVRRYCLPCYDAYLVGVQHGRLTENPDAYPRRVPDENATEPALDLEEAATE